LVRNDPSYAEIAEILIQNGADKNEVDPADDGRSLLSANILRGNTAMARVLLKTGATVSSRDVGDAFRSVARTELVAWLLEYKAVPIIQRLATVRHAVNTRVCTEGISHADRIGVCAAF
jgi:ankyrin repeat protein